MPFFITLSITRLRACLCMSLCLPVSVEICVCLCVYRCVSVRLLIRHGVDCPLTKEILLAMVSLNNLALCQVQPPDNRFASVGLGLLATLQLQPFIYA